MPPTSKTVASPTTTPPFDVQAFLLSTSSTWTSLEFVPLAVIFAQGDPCGSVMYIREGAVKLSVLSRGGDEAIITVLGPGDFLGEGALTQPVRLSTATAVSSTTVVAVSKEQMRRLLQSPDFSGGFIQYMLARNIRIEEDIMDHIFNSSEKRLARALLLAARYGTEENTQGVLPMLSQGMLAEMIGTTRSRVNFFMNKFRKLGFIEYTSGSVTINSSLLNIVLHEKPSKDPIRPPKQHKSIASA